MAGLVIPLRSKKQNTVTICRLLPFFSNLWDLYAKKAATNVELVAARKFLLCASFSAYGRYG